jgi:hypothetical protein
VLVLLVALVVGLGISNVPEPVALAILVPVALVFVVFGGRRG